MVETIDERGVFRGAARDGRLKASLLLRRGRVRLARLLGRGLGLGHAFSQALQRGLGLALRIHDHAGPEFVLPNDLLLADVFLCAGEVLLRNRDGCRRCGVLLVEGFTLRIEHTEIGGAL